MVHSATETGDIEQQTGSAVEVDSTAFSVFSTAQKRWIVLCIAFAGMFSPLSSFIYYPAIHSLATDLHTSVENINLTITVYMLVSGITPSMLGDAADQIGRRPVYLFAFLVYFCANVGLAVQHSYAALLVLRMVQSVGSSGTIAIAYGVVADIAAPSERGSYVGAVLCGPNVAPSLGPVFGAALADRVGWRWIFWFLCILSGLSMIAIFLFLPETARNVVGNGSIRATGINQSLWSRFAKRTSDTAATKPDTSTKKLHIPNPMACLYVILYKDTSIVLLTNAIFYMVYCCIQASLSSSFISIYRYSELQAGLIYLPFGFGCALASYGSGKLMNRDYRIAAKKDNFTIDKVRGDDLSRFPIETARLRSVWLLVGIAVSSIAGYGWSVQTRTHVAVPLILQFLIGTTTTCIFNICGTLLVDLHPHCPATVSASSNLVRCSLSASGLAVLQVIINHIGIGWCFTIFAAIASLTGPLLMAERKWGMTWRHAREQKKRNQQRTEVPLDEDETSAGTREKRVS